MLLARFTAKAAAAAAVASGEHVSSEKSRALDEESRKRVFGRKWRGISSPSGKLCLLLE